MKFGISVFLGLDCSVTPKAPHQSLRKIERLSVFRCQRLKRVIVVICRLSENGAKGIL